MNRTEMDPLRLMEMYIWREWQNTLIINNNNNNSVTLSLNRLIERIQIQIKDKKNANTLFMIV